MKKVCHVLDTLSVGGIEKTALSIALNMKGYEHQVWCLGSKGVMASDAARAGIAVRDFGFSGAMNVSSVAHLAREMRRERFAIVHGHGMYPSIWARVAGILSGVPVRIMHAQSLYYDLPWHDIIKLRALAHVTSKVIAVSRAVKKSLIDGVGIAGGKIEVIYNSSPDMQAASAGIREAVRREIGLGKSYVVGSVGRLAALKGHAFLIEAVGSLRGAGLDVRCVIAGDGPERERLDKMIAAAGLGGVVTLLGPRDDIAPVLAAIDVLVQPSIVKEGLPLVLAEGASAGLPLIATSIGGNAEIAEDGENGFIVPPKDPKAIADKLAFLVHHADVAKAMGERSRRLWEEKFTQKQMLQQVEALYEWSMHG